MQIVPVIDVWQNQVVRGVAGRRDEYQPLRSRITDSTDPATVAWAFRETFGLKTLYLADLDGILDRRPHLDLYAALSDRGHRVWVDAGVQSVEDATRLMEIGVDTVIIGLESCSSPKLLSELVQRFGAERLLFSLDLRGGVPMLPAGWPALDPLEIAEFALAAGFERLLVLDLSDVGTSTGGRTDELLQAVRNWSPSVTLVSGGGVRGSDDLDRLCQLDVNAVLVASALHDGRLTRNDLERFGEPILNGS